MKLASLVRDWSRLVETYDYDDFYRRWLETPGDDMRSALARLPRRATWVRNRALAAWTVVRYQVGGWLCRRYGHVADVVCEEFVAGERDERGRLVDIDGGGVDWFCPRCGQGGRSWF